MDSSIPEPTKLKWWHRHGVQIEIDWNLLPAGRTFRSWLFCYEGDFVTTYQNKKCFWLRGWIRILGLQVGAGVFFSLSR